MRLKTNSAMFSEAIRLSRMTNLEAPESATPENCPSATSPATRPTPTTDIGPLGSRAPSPKAALAMPTIFSGILNTTPAVRATWSPIRAGTATRGCLTISALGEKPMKPTRSMRALPSGPTRRLPWSSTRGTLLRIGVASRLRRLPSRSTTTPIRRPPLGRIKARTSSQLLTDLPAREMIRSPGRIISLAGKSVSNWDDVRALIRPNGGRRIGVVVERDGKRLSLEATPILNNVPRVDDQGNLLVGPDGKALIDRVGFMGFSPSAEIVKQPLVAVPALIGDQVARTAGVVFRIPEKMVGIAKAAFGDGARDPNGPMSVVGVGRVAGEVADGQFSGVADSGASKFVILLSLIASLNIALFVFNLIPLLPLDGGHAAGALWEGLKRQVARLRGRPNPGYVDVAKALPVAYAVSIALIGMSVLLIYADLVNPIKIGG